MNENNKMSDWLRKISDEAKKRADEIDSAVNSASDKPKPVGVAALKPKPDEFAKPKPKAKDMRSLYESKQLRGR